MKMRRRCPLDGNKYRTFKLKQITWGERALLILVYSSITVIQEFDAGYGN